MDRPPVGHQLPSFILAHLEEVNFDHIRLTVALPMLMVGE